MYVLYPECTLFAKFTLYSICKYSTFSKQFPLIFVTCTVHKLIDCLHPMECIPETQFIVRSRIHLAVLLHLRCKCEREEDYSQLEQILLDACFIEEPGSNPGGGKKTFTELEYFKSNTTGTRSLNFWDYNLLLYHCATLTCCICLQQESLLNLFLKHIFF